MHIATSREEASSEFHLPIADIDIPAHRARDLDPIWADALGRIMAKQGQTNAVTIRFLLTGRPVLVTGLHRIEGLRLHGDGTVRCRISTAKNDDEARLEEVMENLGRAELNALDRCRHLHELKQVYERLHPETKAGVAGGRARQGTATEIFSFAVDTAEKIGLSDRAIRIAVKIWTDLSLYSRAKLAGTELAKKQSELRLLSAQSPTVQEKILDLVLDPAQDIDGVQEAIDYLLAKVPMSPAERKFAAFSKRFVELEDTDLDRLILQAEDRVIASLKRRGRI